MNTKKNVLITFSHRVAYAALIPALVWIFVYLPLPEGTSHSEDMIIQVVRWLDLPIAAATQIMPCEEYAIEVCLCDGLPDQAVARLGVIA